jgi:uncharacterized membrane protein YfcA
MEYILVSITVLFGAALTFFSGFGLGTLMLPVFSLFFPLPLAVGATAIVHLSNNIFKFGMLFRHIHYPTLLRFGIPAIIAALVGSLILEWFGTMPVLHSYQLGTYLCEMSTLKIVLGSLMLFFAWFDLDPRFSAWQLDKKWIPLGGFLSGFFGGISGHQGAFRSAFLTKAGLTKDEFLGTSNAIALVIDISRITVYTASLNFSQLSGIKGILLTGIVFAFVGTYFGKKLVKKTTLEGVKRVVGVLLLVLGTLFVLGVL